MIRTLVKRSVFQNCSKPTHETMGKLMKKINGLNRFVKKNADFIRMFTAMLKTLS